jgi:hypothetical protein
MQKPWLDETLAANGRPVQENFGDWFGASKAVDNDGQPLVLYHGTNSLSNGDAIAALDPKYCGSSMGNAYKHSAVFFSESPDVASGYAHSRLIVQHPESMLNNKNYGGNVFPVYLSLQSPLIVDAQGKKFREVMAAAIRRAGNAKKYDSLIVRNVIDSHREGNEASRTLPSTVHVVFDASQIKSAVGNSGLYLKGSASLTDQAEALALQGNAKLDEMGKAMKAMAVVEKANKRGAGHAKALA